MALFIDFTSFHRIVDTVPAALSIGLGDNVEVNPPGANEGSCKIFALAPLSGLSKEQTLSLFGDFYRANVLQNPDGNNH